MKKIYLFILIVLAMITMGCLSGPSQKENAQNDLNDTLNSSVNTTISNAVSIKNDVIKVKRFNETIQSSIRGLTFYKELTEEKGGKNVTRVLQVLFDGQEILAWSNVDLNILVSKDDVGLKANVRLYLWPLINDKNDTTRDAFINETINAIKNSTLE